MATAKMASRFVYVRKAIKYPFNDDEKEDHNRKNNGYGRSLYAESNFINLTDNIDAQRRNDTITKHFEKLAGDRKTKGLHVIISFAEDELKGDEHMKTMTASDITREFIESAYPNTDYFFCIQNDGKSGLIHGHGYIANHDFETGTAISSKHGGWIYKYLINDVTKNYEKENPDLYKFVDPETRPRHGKAQTRLEMKAKEDEVLLFQDYVSQVAEEARQKTGSIDEYEKYLQGKGVEISKRHIQRDDKTVFRYDAVKGYDYPKNMKIGKDSRIRASRLADGQFQHDDLQKFFIEKLAKQVTPPKAPEPEKEPENMESVRKTVKKKQDLKKTVKKTEPEKEPEKVQPSEPVKPVDPIQDMERLAREKLDSLTDDVLRDLNYTEKEEIPEKSVNKDFSEPHISKADDSKADEKGVTSATEEVKPDLKSVTSDVAPTVEESKPLTIQAIKQELKAWGLSKWLEGCNIPGIEDPEATEEQIRQVYAFGLEHKNMTDPKWASNQDLQEYAKKIKQGISQEEEQKTLDFSL